jgi:4-hydroxy-tetrahydrodipicolinate synthase
LEWAHQDHPVSTGVQMSASVILKILKNSPNCGMLKREDSPGLAKLSALQASRERGEVLCKICPAPDAGASGGGL